MTTTRIIQIHADTKPSVNNYEFYRTRSLFDIQLALRNCAREAIQFVTLDNDTTIIPQAN